jgi:hypothetical protein
VLRHSAFFMLKDTSGAEEARWMQKGSAFMRFTAAGPVAIDFGSDLFGGSSVLAGTKPWERTPRWRGSVEGPPCSYDVALHLDFEDEAGLKAYNDDDVHHEIAAYNVSVCQGELTARIDWWYDGDVPLIVPGHVRHAAMFLWRDGVDDATKEGVLEQITRLSEAPGVERLSVGTNVGTLRTDYDWILDVDLPDEDAASEFTTCSAYADAMGALAISTKYEWTARMSHTMHGH